MKKRFNPYRTWAHDGKALSQWTYSPAPIWQECRTCHQQHNMATMIFVENECSECRAKHEKQPSCPECSFPFCENCDECHSLHCEAGTLLHIGC